MVKYPLSKEPIDADSSAESLIVAQNKLQEVFDNLKDAGTTIQANLEGEEFVRAAEFIAQMLEKINDENAKITKILKKLTNEVNEYNSQILDAECNPYYVKKVNYSGKSPTSQNVYYGGNSYRTYNVKEKIFDKYQFNINQMYEANSVFVYNNQKYKWKDVSNVFLSEIGYKNLINDIKINRNVAICYLKNGRSFTINNIYNFNGLKSGIINYFSKNSK